MSFSWDASSASRGVNGPFDLVVVVAAAPDDRAGDAPRDTPGRREDIPVDGGYPLDRNRTIACKSRAIGAVAARAMSGQRSRGRESRAAGLLSHVQSNFEGLLPCIEIAPVNDSAHSPQPIRARRGKKPAIPTSPPPTSAVVKAKPHKSEPTKGAARLGTDRCAIVNFSCSSLARVTLLTTVNRSRSPFQVWTGRRRPAMVRPSDQPERTESQDLSDLSDSDEYDDHDENGSAVGYPRHEQEYGSEWDEPIDVDSVRRAPLRTLFLATRD